MTTTTIPSVRLTKWMRDDILKNVLKYKYSGDSSPIPALQREFASIALAVYNDHYSEKERELMNSLPKDWLNESSRIGARFGMEVSYLNFSGSIMPYTGYMAYHTSGMKSPPDINKRMPSCDCRNIVKVYDHTDALTKRFDAAKREAKKFYKDMMDVKKSIEVTLRSVTTTKRLVEEWPEVKPFVVGHAKVAKPVTSLTVARDDLNRMIGLPVT